MKKIAVIFAVLYLSLSLAHAQEQRQYVSWGFTAGPNLSSYIMRVDPLLRDTLIADTVLNSLPATGMSLGLFLDYHITPSWYLQANGTATLEQSTLRYSDHHSHMLTFGADAGLSVFYRHPWRGGYLLVGFGPYFHFVLYSAATEGINLYRRQIYTDPATPASASPSATSSPSTGSSRSTAVSASPTSSTSPPPAPTSTPSKSPSASAAVFNVFR